MSGEAYPIRRKYDRVTITLEVNYNTDMDFLNSYTRNIGVGGMFIRTIYPLPEGTELNIKFAIPEIKADFSLLAKVVWSAKPETGGIQEESGMGINFINMSKEKSKILQHYLESKKKG
ncbi:MAG: TIGR02266 family protein [bacterium]|nr:TIGR02266 family protein [bacterium]